MKINYQIFIILFFIVYIHCGTTSNCVGSATEIKYCLNKNTDDGNTDHCCYFTAKFKADSSQINQCQRISDNEYNDMDKTIDSFNELYKDVSIDCKSYFLKLGVLSCVLILL